MPNDSGDINYLIDYLLGESLELNDLKVPITTHEKERLLRGLLNVRPPKPISNDFIIQQDKFLQNSIKMNGIIDCQLLKRSNHNNKIILWQGDITTLKIDAIVNAANNQFLGCFSPNHGCIDNAIHTYAGIQLRLECSKIIAAKGGYEHEGNAVLTDAYNLPAKFIIHTVGPRIIGELTRHDCELLTSSYAACLALARQHDIRSIAFCCISTGEFRFPNQLAAEIALSVIHEQLLNTPESFDYILINVFKDIDYKIYSEFLNKKLSHTFLKY